MTREAGRRSLARCTILACGLSLAGCFVVIEPRDVVETPSVSGVLLRDGDPVPGARLWISPIDALGPCEALTSSTQTGPDGAFAFEETRVHRTLEFVPLAPSTPGYAVQVCLDPGDGPQPLYREIFRGAIPRHVRLECDLGADIDPASRCEAARTGREVPGYRGID